MVPSDVLCGISAIQPAIFSKHKKRIVGGVEAVANSWPWHVSLQKSGGSMNQYSNAESVITLQ